MASPELQAMIAAKRANPYTPDKSVEALRAESEAAAVGVELPPGTRCEPVDANGVPAQWISAPESLEDRVFLFIHGGGYYRGSADISRSICAWIARCCRARVLTIDYRLAPEHPFPAAIDDTYTAYGWLLSKGVDAKRIVVGGVSAGGGLTLALLLKLKAMGDPMPAAAVPMSAWADLLQTGASFVGKADEDPSISKPYLDRAAEKYLGSADPRDPLASPLYGELGGLPPLLLQVGSAETLLDDSVEFARRAETAGVDVTLEEWPEMIHGWQMHPHLLPEAREAIEHIAQFCDRHY
ncbi:MAG: alpha/beta hydrolase fold domain-containing protein [Gammaproteobacteria bacterium]|nr:alpha/beta hydrolase fold domain-containing protein [Gammaproteobacteria bacterium]